MSLKYALLGFLNHSTMTGYQLKQHFDKSIRHFWSANLSQIYPTLNQMEKEGLLTMEVEYQEKHPPRKVYRITDAGRRELKSWLAEPIGLTTVRVPFLIKVFFGANLGKEEMLGLLKEQMELHRSKLEHFLEIKEVLKEHIKAEEMEREGFFAGLTVDSGIKLERAWIEWFEEVIEKIEGGLLDK
ncbi:MAG: PadR family transcriptional regulator [Bacillota bacterium]